MKTQRNKENESRCKARKLMRKHHPKMLRTECVHHIDLNPMNNELDNLVIMDKWKHNELHHDLRYGIKPAIKFIKKLYFSVVPY